MLLFDSAFSFRLYVIPQRKVLLVSVRMMGMLEFTTYHRESMTLYQFL